MSTNCRLKKYLKFARLNVCTLNIYGKNKQNEKTQFDMPYFETSVADPERSAYESRRRARGAVREIVYCNDLPYFVTLTFSPDRVDRYDIEGLYKKASNWLREAVRCHGFLYVFVPELHEDGALHLHGFINPGDFELVRARGPSGRALSRKGKPLYNLPAWRWGFSELVPVGDVDKQINYMVSYVSKDKSKIFGKWYLSARACKKKADIIDFPGVDSENFFLENEDVEQTVIWERGYCVIYSKNLVYDEGSVFHLRLDCGLVFRLSGLCGYSTRRLVHSR